MKYFKIYTQREKREIEKALNQQFGIKEIPGKIIRKGRERLFLFLGDMTKKELEKIEHKIIIERVGIYFAKQEPAGIRLSFEATHLFKNQITKNIFEINKKQMEQWMHGNELNVSSEKKGFVVMKYGEDFLGCGKASEKKITNFVPKTRRLRQNS